MADWSAAGLGGARSDHEDGTHSPRHPSHPRPQPQHIHPIPDRNRNRNTHSPGKKGYDWDSFMSIKPCATGRHSSRKQEKAFMGGVDLRAGMEADDDDPYAPQRLDAGKGKKKEKEKKKRWVLWSWIGGEGGARSRSGGGV